MALTEEEKKLAEKLYGNNVKVGTANKPAKEILKPQKVDYTPAAQKRKQTTSENIANTATNNKAVTTNKATTTTDVKPAISAKAVSSEAEKTPTSYVPAAQQRKQAVSDQVYQNVLKGEAYLQSPGEDLAKGLINTLRSGAGKGVEEIAKYAIDQSKNAVQGYTPGDEINVNNRYAAKTAKIIENGQKLGFYDNAQKVVDNNYAGAIADVADQQIATATENANTQLGKDLISAGQSVANMASYMAVGGPFMSALMGAASGAERYNDLREQGMDYEEASVRGGAEAAITAGVGMMSGIGSPMKNVIEETAAKNLLTNVAVQAMSEGGEELLEYTLGYFADVMADKIYKGEVQTTFDISEALRAAYIGALSGGAFGAAGSVTSGDIRSDSVKNIAKDIVAEVKAEVKDNLTFKPKSKTETIAKADAVVEAPVSPVNANVPKVENVAPEAVNEQEGAFANAVKQNKAEEQVNPVNVQANSANDVIKVTETQQTVEEKIVQPDSKTENPITEQEVKEAAEILEETPQEILQEKVPDKELTEEAKKEIDKKLLGKLNANAKKNLDAIDNGEFLKENIVFKGNVPGFNDLQRAVIVNQLLTNKTKGIIDIKIPNDGELEVNNDPLAVAALLDQLKVSIDTNSDAELSKNAEVALKKSEKIAHFKSKGKDYLTNGFFAIRTNESGKDKIAKAYPKAYIESDQDVFKVFEKVEAKEVAAPPKEITHGKEKFYVFPTDNGDYVFNKSYVDLVDGGEMFIGEHGAVGAYIKVLDDNGNITGLVLSLNKASAGTKNLVEEAKTKSVPAKLKSFSPRKKSPAKKKDNSGIWEEAEKYSTQNNSHPNTVGGMESQNTFYKSIKEFGAQPLRKEQVAKDNYLKVPKKISDNLAMSEDVGYMAGSALGDDAYMDDVIQHPEKYAHIINTDVNSYENAVKNIEEKGLEARYGVWEDKIQNKKMIEKDDITEAAIMSLLYSNKAKNEADPKLKEEYREKALNIKTDINYAATKGGQLLQSIQMLQKITGTDGINLKTDGEYMANRLVEKLNKDHKGKKVVLNQGLVNKAIDAAGTDAEGKAWDEVYKDIANQASTSFWERVNNYRYWCMLSNPRTHVRNTVSNASMAIVNSIKDATKIPVEAIFNATMKAKANANKGKVAEVDNKLKQLIATKGSKAEIEKLQKQSDRLHGFENAREKTAAFYNPKNLGYTWNDFKTAKEKFDTTSKYDNNANSFLREYKTNKNSDFIGTYLSKKIEGNNKFSKGVKTVLEHGLFGSVMDFNSWLLSDIEDGAAKQVVYSHELAQRMAANKITPETANNPENIKKMDELRAEAFAEALYNTFNEDNTSSELLRKLGEKGLGWHIAVEALLPFKKVTLNIPKIGLDYSPIGFAKGVGEMAKVMHNPNSMDPGKAINDIAKGLTGLELAALGYFLRSIGKITNGLSDDEKEAKFEKLLGEQAFAIKFDDGSSYSLEWLGSSVMPMFSGAVAYDTFNGMLQDKLDVRKENGEIDFWPTAKNYGVAGLSGLLGLVSSVADPMLAMSMLSTLEYTLTGQYNSLGEVALDFAGDYANQFVPQVLNAITKVKDNTKRNVYYVDKTDNISDAFQVPIQAAISKVPGQSSKLSAQIDAWGREQKHSDRETKVGWAFDAFISPGTYKTDKTTEQDKLISQLVADTGNTSLYPKGPSQKYVTVNKVEHPLSAKEYEEMAREKGQKQFELIGQLIPDDTYKKLSTEEQEKVVAGVYEYAGALSKEGVHGYKLPKEWQKVQEAKKDGLAESTYLSLKPAMGATSKDIDKMKYLIADKGTSAKEKVVAMEYLTDINMDKYKKFSSDPQDIINARMIYLEEDAKGKGASARMVDRIIADKGTSAKEDVAFIKNIVGIKLDNYEKAAKGDAQRTLDLYKIIGTDTAPKGGSEKDVDIKQIMTKFNVKEPQAREMYYKSKGDWSYSLSEVIDNGSNRESKVPVYKRFNFSESDIIAGYNAIIGYSKKDDKIKALARVFGSTAKATTFYNISQGNKGYK